ncbi:MAG: HNH endonuclease [Ilumatobacteraceae bacterium]
MLALDEITFRESVFAWLRTRMLVQPVFTRDDLSNFEYKGSKYRLVGTQTGIWKPRELDSALSILTAYVERESDRPYHDGLGADQMYRYKWRGTDPNIADNRWLRDAMIARVPLVWFIGVGYAPGTRTQVFQPVMPVWLISEEPSQQQFVVALDNAQRELIISGHVHVGEIERRYNERMVKVRVHQPLFRTQVLHAYERRCAVCRLPFEKLLDAAHIKGDAEGGDPHLTNGMSLCKIHHGAFDAHILGISPDYRVHISESVLNTFDGPTLQHALKEMNGESLRQLPVIYAQRPSKELLAERFEQFRKAS